MAETAVPETTGVVEIPASKAKRIIRAVSWTFLGLLFLTVFTLMKLPEERLKNYIQGSVSAALAPRGITLSAGNTHLSFGIGITYVMNDVTLSFPPPDASAHIDKIEVSPSLLPLLIGRIGGKVWLRNSDGKAVGSFSMKGSQMSASFDATKLDIGKLGLLPALAGVKASAIVNGTVDFSGDMNEPRNDSGQIDLQLDKIVFDQQSIQGFSIPRVFISEGKIEVSVENGKATFKTVRLGKSDTDDIRASVTGDLTLGKIIDASTINARTTLSFSQNFMHSFGSFSLLESMALAPGKQADGSYAFNLTGQLGSLQANPAGGK